MKDTIHSCFYVLWKIKSEKKRKEECHLNTVYHFRENAMSVFMCFSIKVYDQLCLQSANVQHSY